jgi:hypothetical protein
MVPHYDTMTQQHMTKVRAAEPIMFSCCIPIHLLRLFHLCTAEVLKKRWRNETAFGFVSDEQTPGFDLAGQCLESHHLGSSGKVILLQADTEKQMRKPTQ